MKREKNILISIVLLGALICSCGIGTTSEVHKITSPIDKTIWILDRLDNGDSDAVISDYYLNGISLNSQSHDVLSGLNSRIKTAIDKYGFPTAKMITIESTEMIQPKISQQTDSVLIVTTLSKFNTEGNYTVTMDFVEIDDNLRLINMSTKEETETFK